MSNSNLVTVTMISPHSRPRTRKPDAILIHHMACVATAEACGASFRPSYANASTNYGVGYDGSVGLYVDESLASKSQPNFDANDRSIAIEVSNDGRGPDWHVGDVALEKLIELCVDICQRNGIEKLNYTGDATGNLLMHNWFQPTACPGPYLSSKFPWIAEEVNRRLGVVEEKPYLPIPSKQKKHIPIPVIKE